MKIALLIPLAFLAGAHGFALFAPYLALFLAAVSASHVLRRRRGRFARAYHVAAPALAPALAAQARRTAQVAVTPTFEM